MSEEGDGPRVFTVAQVADALARVVRDTTRTVWVRGEVTNAGKGGGGKLRFFRLRDPDGQAQLEATILGWETQVPFDLVDGITVRVRAKPEFFPPHGSLRLHVYEIAPDGDGTLLARVEALRRRLDAEGLFSAARKRALPALPRRVGLVTARDGAARHDVERTLHSRCPATDLVIVTALMQGAGSPAQVVRALAYLDADPTVDVVIVARGGGSLEDLMAFNDERVARAIAACRTPVVAAIGHERDHTIACEVADVRVATPTAAAMCVVPDVASEMRALAQQGARARDALRRALTRAQRDVAAAWARPCLARPLTLLAPARTRQAELERRLRSGLLGARDRAAAGLATQTALLPRALRGVVAGREAGVAAGRERLAAAGRAAVARAERSLELDAERLAGRDPTRPLRLGFALVSGPDGRVVPSASGATAAGRVRLRFADGSVGARVEGPVEEGT